MALSSSKELPTGVIGTYWRVTFVELSVLHSTLTVAVSLYLDRPARDAGREPLDKQVTSFGSVTLASTKTAVDIVALAYEKLKTLPELAEAADV